VDDAVLRQLRMELRFRNAEPVSRDVMASPAHAALAREAAQKSIVLLKNAADILPLKPDSRLAVIGHLAAVPNTGDGGSSNTVSPHIVTPLEGLRAAFQHVTHDDGFDLERAKEIAQGAEAVLVVVGYTKDDEGEFVSPDTTANLRSLFPAPMTPEEIGIATAVASGLAARAEESGAFSRGGDRAMLRLRETDEALIRAVSGVNNHVVVAVMSGSAVLMNAWEDAVQGILMLWYPGMEGGHALADVLLGTVNPSGKLPFSIARDEAHYPHFERDATTITYDLWHGYRKLERDGNTAAYPFGFGLSYTTYAYKNVHLELREDKVQLSLQVTNTGQRAGEEIVQVYVSALNSAVERPVKELRAFTRVALLAGETKTVSLSIPTSSLAYFNEEKDDFVLEALEYEFIAARHSADSAGLRSRLRIG
jgi:beta-glucosidase